MTVVSSLLHDILLVLPYALAVAGFYLFLRLVYHVRTPIRPLFLWPIICALVGTGFFMMWGHYHIATTHSKWWVAHGSFPLYAVVVALGGYVVAWILFYVFRFLFEGLRTLSLKFKQPR